MEKVFFITGASRGIGRALAEHYLEKGHKVVGCSRSESDLRHASYHHQMLDITSEEAVVKGMRDVGARFGRLDVLINNAGRAAMNHVLTMPHDTARALVDCNLLGTFVCLREAARLMQKNRFGRIVNFTTVAVPLRLEGESLYAASKAGVESLTRTAARELSSFGITVNAIGPTPVDTDLTRAVPRKKLEALVAQQAIKRMGEKSDILHVCDFFVDEASHFVTGQILYLGGVG